MHFSRKIRSNCFLRICIAAFSVFAGRIAISQDQAEVDGKVSDIEFPMEELHKVPQVFPADELKTDGVRSLFYSGLDYHGKPTRIFAYYGVPSESIPDGSPKKYPAMVLIHGGGGTAFANWVKLWNSRGYAAIAMDLCGCVPVGTYGNWQRHPEGGPPGWDASFAQIDEPIGDQWTMHAVSAATLAHSLIRSFPEVDADRIGVTGISWGGYLTSIVAGVDQRFRFAAPVYGCGFLGDNSVWLPSFERMGKEKATRWLEQWDPSRYLPNAKMPILWVNGTNDFAYPMDSWKKSYQLPKSKRMLCLRVRMPHGHGPAGENPEEIRVFADSILASGVPLPEVQEQRSENGIATAKIRSASKIIKAELCFTKSHATWPDRLWETLPAEYDAETGIVTAGIPEEAVVYYLNVFDDRDCVVSSEHWEK